MIDEYPTPLWSGIALLVLAAVSVFLWMYFSVPYARQMKIELDDRKAWLIMCLNDATTVGQTEACKVQYPL